MGKGVDGSHWGLWALAALLLLEAGLGWGCTKRTWEIGPKARKRPVPREEDPSSPGKRREKRKEDARKGGRKEGPPSLPGRPACPGRPGERRPCDRGGRGERLPCERADFLRLLPSYPWPSLRPPGWKEKERAWDPVAWFGRLRKDLETLPQEWVLSREALLAREASRLAPAGKAGEVLRWETLPPLPPLRGGRDVAGRPGFRAGRKVFLPGFLLRAGSKGPCFLVPDLFPLRRGRIPPPGERILVEFREGDSMPGPFAAVLVRGTLHVGPAWSGDTMMAAFVLRPEEMRVLP